MISSSVMSSILPAGVSVCELTGAAKPDRLYPEEEALVSRAVLRRRREFALSRTCARRALADIGVAPLPILSTPDRAPMWPPGVIGSITHCDSYTAAAVCSSRHFLSLGIDAEINQPLPEEVPALISSVTEQLLIRQLPDSSICWDRVLFSAKESIFKAWFPIAKRWLDFRDAEVTIDPLRFTFHAEILVESHLTGPSFDGRFMLHNTHLLTAVWLPHQ